MGATAATAGGPALDHVGFFVPDLGQAVGFFVDNFGARQLFRLERPRGAGGGAAAADLSTGSERLAAEAGAEFALAMLEVGNGRLELLQWWTGRAPGQVPEADQAGGAHIAVEVGDVRAELDRLRQVDGVSVVGEPVDFSAGPTPGLTNAFLRAPWGLLIELVRWTDSPPKEPT
jgi:catechol 2,3-dioxygenase-like lactoylglutathione lyase family enzyme